MSRAAENSANLTPPTMTEIDVYRFCRSLLNWEGVHLVGEERVGTNLRVLLSTDVGEQQWVDSLEAAEAFRARHGEQVQA